MGDDVLAQFAGSAAVLDDLGEEFGDVGPLPQGAAGLDPGDQHRGRTVVFFLVDVAQDGHAAAQPVRGARPVGEGVRHDADQAFPAAFAQGADQVFLAREVVEEGAAGHVGAFGDLVDGRLVVALLGEEFQRRRVQALFYLDLVSPAAPQGPGPRALGRGRIHLFLLYARCRYQDRDTRRSRVRAPPSAVSRVWSGRWTDSRGGRHRRTLVIA
nr:hypothetical protein [Streptomyces griseofuscus]